MPKAYKQTSVPWEKSQGDITGLLMSHGARGIRWTNVFERHEIHFEFAQTIVVEGVEKHIGVEIKVPIEIPIKEDRWGDQVEVSEKDVRKATNQAYRAVYWWLKSQLEAVEFGIQRFEQVFFANIITRLQDGRQTTVGEAFNRGLLNQTDFQLEEPDIEVLPPTKEN